MDYNIGVNVFALLWQLLSFVNYFVGKTHSLINVDITSKYMLPNERIITKLCLLPTVQCFPYASALPIEVARRIDSLTFQVPHSIARLVHLYRFLHLSCRLFVLLWYEFGYCSVWLQAKLSQLFLSPTLSRSPLILTPNQLSWSRLSSVRIWIFRISLAAASPSFLALSSNFHFSRNWSVLQSKLNLSKFAIFRFQENIPLSVTNLSVTNGSPSHCS